MPAPLFRAIRAYTERLGLPMQHQFTPSEIERFWAKVDQGGAVPAHRPDLGPCWLWTASRATAGYGQFKGAGTMRRTHRVAFEIAYGPIPDGLSVLHACDNRLCVRNDDEGWYEVNGILHPRRGHLWLGTQQDNIDDMIAKGRDRHDNNPRGDLNGSRLYPERLKRGDQNGSRLHPELLLRGEAHHQCKLTEDQVHAIRQRYAAGGISQPQLAREYGIGQSQVNRILLRQTWRRI